jgi:hypothetical protein
MDEQTHEVQFVVSSMDDIKQLLGVTDGVKNDAKVSLSDGLTLEVTDVAKSRGFEVTTLIVTGLVTVATSTASAVLIEYLKSKLFKSGGAKPPNITIIIDGKELKPASGSGAP